jgi:undecaprenyl diphosphate synthase
MHVAIIMDGNGRWAERLGLPRTAGHRAGARAVKDVVEAAAEGPVDILTLYAFSEDNWTRPRDEVNQLMRLFERHLIGEAARCADAGVRVSVIGRRDRLGARLARTIERTEAITRDGTRLTLRLAVDYSARAMLARAAAAGTALEERLAALGQLPASALDVDLLIRTGGEQRLSDFLLWECAYAELLFVPTFWPDFDAPAFRDALDAFARRERRFGGLLNEPVAGPRSGEPTPAMG